VIRKVLSVGLSIVAGFFFYMVCLLSFITRASLDAKWLAIGVFTVPAVLALAAGLAVARFESWTRVVGVVLLSAAGFTAFLIFTLACLMMSEEIRKVFLSPNSFSFFDDYITGAAVIIVLAVAGALLLIVSRARRRSALAPQ
jgi:hypothetical protein